MSSARARFLSRARFTSRFRNKSSRACSARHARTLPPVLTTVSKDCVLFQPHAIKGVGGLLRRAQARRRDAVALRRRDLYQAADALDVRGADQLLEDRVEAKFIHGLERHLFKRRVHVVPTEAIHN